MYDKTAYDFSFAALDGSALPLSRYAGEALLIVNTASECGYTPQYEELETLWQTYRDRGLTVIGVPCNQFGAQEPGSAAEIGAFCRRNYGVSFPMAAKTDVKGQNAHPFYVWAAAQAGAGGAPKWNFHKYLTGKTGALCGSFSSAAKPMGPKIKRAVEAALG